MRRLILLVGLMLLAGPAALGQISLYVSPDVGTDPDGPPTYLPWDVLEHVNGGPAFYGVEFTVPGNPAIDAVHKLDTPNNWLFSVEAPSDLGGLFDVQPEDVVRRNAGVFSPFFDGSCVAPPIPPSSNIDALFMVDDGGILWMVFDVPTDIGGTTYRPSEIVGYSRNVPVPGPCDWTFGGPAIDLAVVSTTYFPVGSRITGVDTAPPNNQTVIVAFDVPVDLAPTVGPTTYLPGQIAAYSLLGASWNLFEDLQTQGIPGWPVSSEVDALSCEANPGRINSPTDQILMDKTLPMVSIVCPGGCSSGGENYGIYQGTIANIRNGIYDHAAQSCTNNNCPGANGFAPGPGSFYYLVVPHSFKEEGSYCTANFSGVMPQRPPAPAALACAPVQNLTACP